MISSGWGQRRVTGARECKEIEIAEQLLASQKTLQAVQLVTSLQENLLKFVKIIEIFLSPRLCLRSTPNCAAHNKSIQALTTS